MHESSFDQPWQPTYQAAMLAAIVDIEISITEIQCEYTLRQDQIQIKEHLQKLDSTELAGAMFVKE